VRRRLDAELVRRGLAESRTQARTWIEAGKVRVGGAPATKAARMVDAGEALLVEGDRPRYVGRGGEKLEAALAALELDPGGLRVLDAGASTGGFTDCLLQHGAHHVVALDVGHGQLHERLRGDERVTVLERTNLRHVEPDDLGAFPAVVADLSFISLTAVMERLVQLAAPGAWLLLLVKPQFEAGRQQVSRGRGVITDPQEWLGALQRVAAEAARRGAVVRGALPSPLRGAEGNVEFLLALDRTGQPAAGLDARALAALDAAVGAAVAHEAATPAVAEAAR
jgi:23S rRNA (cytidine1920-2'-O)/16S rRNA (cytidine1409-2'-O)-methyltransferase